MDAAKKMKMLATQAPRSGLHCVLHVEIVVVRVLHFLDKQSLDATVTALRHERDFGWVLKETQLWGELMALHFHAEHDGEAMRESDSEEEDDDDDDDGDYGDGDDDEGEEEDEGEGDANGGQALIAVNGSETQAMYQGDATIEEAGNDAVIPAPCCTSWLASCSPDLVCDALQSFVGCLAAWQRFQDRVHVLQGDLSSITTVLDGERIDAISFPAGAMLGNPHTGAAGAVFRRAGDELDEHCRSRSQPMPTGTALVTPGFNAGVRVLIHCHGPGRWDSTSMRSRMLYTTYTSVLRAAQSNKVHCLAMASISTGNLGVPMTDSARAAMRALRSFQTAHPEWTARVVVVCDQPALVDAFQTARQQMLDHFDAELPRVTRAS